MNTVIFYDRDPDGLAAAITVALHQGVQYSDGKFWGPNFEFRPAIRYEGPNLEGIDKETTVYVVDFCYKGKFIASLCAQAKEVVVLDHHGESTDNDLDGFTADNLIVVNDTKHAACVVAWMFLNEADDEYTPSILKFIEDMDLWKWALPNSSLVSAYLDSVEPSIEAYFPLISGEMSLGDVLDRGQAVLDYKNKTMDILEKQAVLMDIAGYKVPAVNCSDPSIVSYLGNRLAKDQPFAATWYLQPNGKLKFSIRSITGEGLPGISVREVAQKFGGGGHPNASGFKVDKLFPFEVIKDSEVSR
jgi:oligoribonuclease NrnB/cAMP/cGMP phosphodiesterase (DHH superfamily)